MKQLATAVVLLLFVNLAAAQERVPAEDAQKFARIFIENAAKFTDAQLKTDVDADKAFAMKKDQHAALVIPDKKLSADALAKAGKDVIPLGQLWFHKLKPLVNNQAAANDTLRIVTITHDGEDHSLPMFFLGVRKKGGGDDLELLVYAKEKEPLLVLPLQKADTAQELPIEFGVEKGNVEKTGILTFKVLGKYQAKLVVTAPE